MLEELRSLPTMIISEMRASMIVITFLTNFVVGTSGEWAWEGGMPEGGTANALYWATVFIVTSCPCQ